MIITLAIHFIDKKWTGTSGSVYNYQRDHKSWSLRQLLPKTRLVLDLEGFGCEANECDTHSLHDVKSRRIVLVWCIVGDHIYSCPIALEEKQDIILYLHPHGPT